MIFFVTETQWRKQKIRKAQKSIMLFDPRSNARKPRKESVQLLFSIDSLFHLSTAFKACNNPDFLLATIGSTSRDSIERAYDWLIPTISSSADIINRLPPSASCFLLLRAYGAEGNENNQLLDLSSPLLKHVNDSIAGNFGLEGAQRAVDIIFFDLADKDSDKRRCARRVLQESFGKLKNLTSNYPKFAGGEFSWLISLTETKYASSLVMSVAPRLVCSLDFSFYLSDCMYVTQIGLFLVQIHALSFEREKVLRAYIMALDYYSRMDITHQNISTLNLSSCICDLLSSRPKICITAMDRFDDLRTMMIHTCRLAIETNDLKPNELRVSYSTPSKKNMMISLSLVRASLVLIASWNERIIPLKSELMDIVEFLLPEQVENLDNISFGVTSATFVDTNKRAISVEDVSRSSFPILKC